MLAPPCFVKKKNWDGGLGAAGKPYLGIVLEYNKIILIVSLRFN